MSPPCSRLGISFDIQSRQTHSGWVVVVSVDREDRYGNVDVGVFVVDVIERPKLQSLALSVPSSRGTLRIHLPLKSLRPVTQHLQLARLLPQAIHTQRAHDLIHGLPRGFCPRIPVSKLLTAFLSLETSPSRSPEQGKPGSAYCYRETNPRPAAPCPRRARARCS